MKEKLKRLRWPLVALFSGVLALAAVSPQFLQFTEPPIDSDAIVVMVGPSYPDRVRAAQTILDQRLARYLIVPAYCVIFSAGVNGNLEAQLSMLRVGQGPCADPSPLAIREGTHRELELAREIMEHLGFRSVNLVSSPYHMRRIKVIADHVFAGSVIRYACISAPSDGSSQGAEFHDMETWWWVTREYTKLAWFIIYSRFV
jgi:hypothetical protein